MMGKAMTDALKHESDYFHHSPVYAPFASKLGVPYLSKTLNILIVRHIKVNLPKIRSKINAMLFEKEKELKSLNVVDDEDQMTVLLTIIAKYSRCFGDLLEGKFVKDTAIEMLGGSRINHIFYEIYTKEILKIDPFDALTDDDIKTALRNASSLRPNLFIPEVAFETLSKQQIWRL
jgi:dynamin 1-like protein